MGSEMFLREVAKFVPTGNSSGRAHAFPVLLSQATIGCIHSSPNKRVLEKHVVACKASQENPLAPPPPVVLTCRRGNCQEGTFQTIHTRQEREQSYDWVRRQCDLGCISGAWCETHTTWKSHKDRYHNKIGTRTKHAAFLSVLDPHHSSPTGTTSPIWDTLINLNSMMSKSTFRQDPRNRDGGSGPAHSQIACGQPQEANLIGYGPWLNISRQEHMVKKARHGMSSEDAKRTVKAMLQGETRNWHCQNYRMLLGRGWLLCCYPPALC